MSESKLNIGCGRDIRKDWINLDIAALPGVNVVHNIEKLPLPFEDSFFDEVLCQDILEHIEYIPVLRDIHRIMKDGGKLTVRVPHFTSKNNYVDPTHRKLFSVATLAFFVKEGNVKMPKCNYYFDFHFAKFEKGTISFSRKYIYNIPIEFLINLHPRLQDMYESTFLSRIFPAANLLIQITK